MSNEDPAHWIEILDDRPGFLACVPQACELAHSHAAFRRAFAGGVSALDQGGYGLLQGVHAPQYTPPIGQ